MNVKKFNVWKGVYKDFKETPQIGQGFSSSRWVDNSRVKALEFKEALDANKSIPEKVGYKTTLLPVLISMIDNNHGKKVILDFGGGLGIKYIQLISTLVDNRNIEYHIVESENICVAGKDLFQEDKKIKFHEFLPVDIEHVDVQYICSVLQYIEDWKGLIRRLADYRPQYFLFEDLFAGDIQTYVSIQNYYGSKIPHWFLNIDEVLKLMKFEKYKLIFKSSFFATILGKEQELPMNNFPKECRLKRTCNLLLRREEI